jgi:hypothetical protein
MPIFIPKGRETALECGAQFCTPMTSLPNPWMTDADWLVLKRKGSSGICADAYPLFDIPVNAGIHGDTEACTKMHGLKSTHLVSRPPWKGLLRRSLHGSSPSAAMMEKSKPPPGETSTPEFSDERQKEHHQLSLKK